MTRREQYFVGVLVVAPLWFIASLMLGMKLLNAEDPGQVIGEIVTHVDGHEIHSFDPNYKGKHQGELPPVPVWLKVANSIASPVLYLLPDSFPGLSDGACLVVFLSAIFAKSLFKN